MIFRKHKFLLSLLFILLAATLFAFGVYADDETPTVPIDPPDVTAIKLKSLPVKTFYLVGEKLDMSGAELELTYDSGTKGTTLVKLEWTSGFNSSKEGVQKITVTYPGTKCKTTFNVEVVSEKSLKVFSPNTLTYFVGDAEDRSGLSVSVVYSNGKSAELAPSDYTVTGFSTNTIGDKTITISYKKLTASYKITVFEPALTKIEISKVPNKLTYYIGEPLDSSGLAVTAYYENGKTADVTPYVTVSGDVSSAGSKNVTVSYSENDRIESTIYRVTVIGVEVRNIVFATYPNKTTYYEGEFFDPTGISVTVTYNNGEVKTVSEGIRYMGFESETVGEKTVTLFYDGFQLDFKVNVTVSPSHVHKESEFKTTSEPTCTLEGSESTTCLVCFAVVTTRAIAPLGHGIESMPIQTKAPNCTEDGSTATYCMICNDVATVTILPALGHTEGAPQFVVIPTCTTGGLTKTYCKVCQAEVNAYDLKAYGHEFSPWVLLTEATGENDGMEERVCATCQLVENNIIPKLVRTLTSAEFNVTLGGNAYFPSYSNFYGSCITESLSVAEKIALTLTDASGKEYEILEVFDFAVTTSKGEDFIPSSELIFSAAAALPYEEYSSFIVYDEEFNEIAYFDEGGKLSIVCDGNGRFVLAGEVLPEETEVQTDAVDTEPEQTDSIPVSGIVITPNNYVQIALLIVAFILLIAFISCICSYASKRKRQ